MSRGIADILPLAPAQQGLLFHALLTVDGPDPYLVQARFTVSGPLDAAALRGAVAGLLRRHPNLRACFRHHGLDQPVQLIPLRAEVPWTETDLRGQDFATAEAELERILTADRLHRFDVTRPPLLRAMLVRRDDGAELVLTMHHILVDGWSMPILAQELGILYERGESPLPPVAPYRDYLAWLRDQDPAATRQAWRAALAGLAAPTPLGAGGDGIPVEREIELSAELSAALVGTARAAGCTPGVLAQLAWALVVARSTGRDDVVFGGVVSGRPAQLRGVESMVGLFINTLPVRVRLRAGESVAQLLRRIQQEQQDLTPHHQARLVDVQQDAGLGDLFDSVLAFENYPRDGLASGNGLQLVATRDATHYPLSLAVVADERWLLRLVHRPGTDAARLLGRLAVAFQALVADGALDRPAELVEVLEESERTGLISAGRGTVRPPAPQATVTARFGAQVARTPDATALESPQGDFSYLELEQAAGELAARLAAAGAGPETPVALLLPRSAELVIAQLAVLTAGGFYLPLDPAHPPGRLLGLLRDSGAQLVVVRDTAPDWLPEGMRVLTADGTAHGTAEQPRSDVPQPGSAVCLMYTSGSGGEPKGVVTPHQAVVELAADSRFPAHRRVLFHSAYTFDASTYEVWVPLLTGGTVVVGPGVEIATLGRNLRAHRIAVLWLTAELFRTVADLAPEALTGLTEVWTGGDVVAPEAVRAVRRACPDTVVVNGYGPTETTVFATSHRVGADPVGPLPIGRPLDNTRAYVLDARLRPSPTGTTGELYLAGSGLARGYHGRAAATAERFVADPYGPPGARMYRTGDLAHFTAAGPLAFDGRADAQVKVRGFRVEPGEVEAALRALDGVRQAVVTARPGPAGGKRLAAYLLLAEDTTADQVRTRAAAVLPGHLLPSLWTVLERLPLTSHGKLDRAALPEPLPAAARPAEPASDRERTLCKLFAEVLGLPGAGPDTDFFQAGGHSLLALRLSGRIEAELGGRVPVGELFTAPTPAALTARLERGADVPAAQSLDPVLTLRAGDSRPALFCLHYGLGLAWSYATLMPGLAPGRAVYGLQSPALSDFGAPLPQTVAAIADQYLTRIRAVQPEGPYALLGYSFGGLLAVEIAARLRAQGQEVVLTAVLDFVPRTPEAAAVTWDTDELDQETLKQLLLHAAPTGPQPTGRLDSAAVFDAVRGPDGAFAGQGVEPLAALLPTRANHIRLTVGWRPPPYGGRILLVSAGDEPALPPTGEKAARWRHSTAAVDVLDLRCTHEDLLTPRFAPGIAAAVETALRTHTAPGGLT
ncbi:amino acid adenylation domain-containing protein [Streptomyces sp. NPDC005125]